MPVPETAETLNNRINGALFLALQYASIDGDHHKAWCIDQMIRILTGCPIVTREGKDRHGNTFTIEQLGESEEYKDFVRQACAGEDGPDTYDWDTGIPP